MINLSTTCINAAHVDILFALRHEGGRGGDRDRDTVYHQGSSDDQFSCTIIFMDMLSAV